MNADSTNLHAKAVLAGGLATLGLTAAHHVYGAILYETPWRHHAAVVGAVGSLVLWIAYLAYTRHREARRGRIALGVMAAVAGIVAVLLIGLFEGFYNHVLKDVLYFAGLPLDVHRQLFPPPKYELPNDVIFEISGVLQAVTGAYTALALVRLTRGFLRGRAAGAQAA